MGPQKKIAMLTSAACCKVALMYENDLIGVTASGLQLRQLKALLSYGGSSDWPHFRILLKPNFQSALDTQTVLDSTDRGDRKEKKCCVMKFHFDI
ncbi:Exostosin-1c [Trichinella pseudospiralis]